MVDTRSIYNAIKEEILHEKLIQLLNNRKQIALNGNGIYCFYPCLDNGSISADTLRNIVEYIYIITYDVKKESTLCDILKKHILKDKNDIYCFFVKDKSLNSYQLNAIADYLDALNKQLKN